MGKKEKIAIVYMCIHNRLCKNFGIGKTIKKRDVTYILGHTYHVPKQWLYPVIKEMINYGLLEDSGRFNVTILESKLNVEDTSMIYKGIGMF